MTSYLSSNSLVTCGWGEWLLRRSSHVRRPLPIVFVKEQNMVKVRQSCPWVQLNTTPWSL